MTAEDVVLEVVQALDAANVPYMIVGSLSSNVYGIRPYPLFLAQRTRSKSLQKSRASYI